MTDFMAQHGEDLIDNNWPIIPIMPGSKAPGRFSYEKWENYPNWTRHCERPSKPFEVDIWRRWPDCAIGIACGRVVGIDIDITDALSALMVERIAKRIFGDTPLLRIGQAPKRMLVYQAAAPFPSFQQANIQILAHGRQFLAYAIHPVTGKPYEWPEESPLDVDLSSVPVITEAQCRQFLAEAFEALPPELRASRLPDAPKQDSGMGQRGTREAVADALRWLPNDDWHYDDWIGVGLAIKGALGEEGRDLWLEWCDKAKKNDPAVSAKKWDREMKNPKSGAGTIYFFAQRYGWVPPSEMILDAETAARVAEPHPAQALIDKIMAQDLVGVGAAQDPVGERAQVVIRRSPESEKIPLDLMAVDGLLGDMMASIVASAEVPQPWLALGASLAACGVLMGRRYRAPSGLRTNLYTVGIADSGGGKDHARRWIRQAFRSANVQEYLGGQKIASAQAILTSLSKHAAKLYQIDEFGHFLSGVLSARAATHQRDILTVLTELYSSYEGWFQGTEYANQDDKPRQDLCDPTCCIHATTVPGSFWSALGSGNSEDGSLARWLIFQTDDSYPPYNETPSSIQAAPRILEAMQALTFGAEGHDYGGNLAMLMDGKTECTPYTVPFQTSALALSRELREQQRDWQRQSQGTSANALLARYRENTIKVALVRAASYDPARPVIRLVDLEWAAKLVEYCTHKTVNEAAVRIADTETEKKLLKVLRTIRAGGGEGLTKNELTRRTQFVSGRERGDIIASLIEGGQIECVQIGGLTKPTIRYLAVEGDSSR